MTASTVKRRVLVGAAEIDRIVARLLPKAAGC